MFSGHLLAEGHGRSKAYTKLPQNISSLNTVTSFSSSIKAPKLQLQLLRKSFPYCSTEKELK